MRTQGREIFGVLEILLKVVCGLTEDHCMSGRKEELLGVLEILQSGLY